MLSFTLLPTSAVASSLDPNQARQDVGPDLGPNCLTLLMVFPKEFFKEVDFEKISRRQKSMQNYAVGKDLTFH